MASLEELKNRAKAATMIALLSSASLQAQEHQEMPDARDDTHTEMRIDAKRAEIICENPETYLDIKEATAKKLTQQLNAPVSEENKTVALGSTAVGPFPGCAIEDTPQKSKHKYKPNFSSPKAQTDREIREIKSKEDYYKYDDMAYFDPTDKKLYIPKWVVSDEMADLIKKRLHGTWEAKLTTGDPAAEIAAERHENTHFTHDARGQTDTDRFEFLTSDMFVERDYATEKLAYSVQCLTLANIYSNCKKAGMETIEVNGEKMPIGSVMNQIPGLQETVEKNGFDPTSKESVANIVTLASNHWDKTYLEGYSDGQFSQQAQGGSSANIINQIQAAREQKKVLLDMTKNLDIGYHTKIDIPAECMPMLMPKTEITQNITRSVSAFSPSTDGLLAIDKYLDECGLKNDKDKDKYIKEQYKNIVNRTPDADAKLKDLMLKCGNSDDWMIFYSDNLQVNNYQNIGVQTVSADMGRTVYPLTRLDERLNLTDNKEKSPEHNSPTKATKVLTPTEISAAMQRNHSK